MKLDAVRDALDAIAAGGRARDLESETLDFKRDPHTVKGTQAPGNPKARLIEELVDATVCFANATGGHVVVGVDDRMPGPEAIIGCEVDRDFVRHRIHGNTRPPLTLLVEEIEHSGQRLLVLTVPEGLDLITDAKGKASQRSGTDCHPMSEDARRALTHQRRNPDYSARPTDVTLADLDLDAIEQARRFLRELTDLRSQMADLPVPDLMRALSLVDRDDRLLTAAEILFARPSHDVADLLLRPSAGAEPSVRRFRDPLVSLLPRLQAALHDAIDPERDHLSLVTGQEVALPDFSPIAVDEAVTNALVHRDYGLGDRVVVDHSPQSLRVWSPGSLPYGVTAERLLSTVSVPRSPVLMGAMQQMGLAERASRGIDRMFREQIRVGQVAPNVRADDFSVEVYFSSSAPNRAFAGFVATQPESVKSNVDALLVLAWLCAHATLTLDGAEQLLQVGRDEAAHKVDTLAAAPFQLVERDGDKRRGTRWRLSSEAATGLGTAVVHRTRAAAARPRVEAHLAEYGWITNKTLRNMFDLDVQQASQMLADLRGANVIEKDPSGPQRGPGIRWLPANKRKKRAAE